MNDDTPKKGSARVIKRYSNRKLYDTRESRYVTLQTVADYVRNGEEVAIIDNTTKEDLTEVTLAQIVFEEQRTKGKSVPLQTWKDLLQTRTEKVLEGLREGPIGRLIPGAREGGKTEPPPEPEKRPSSLVDQAKENLQQLLDERIGSILSSFRPFHELQKEVDDLRTRIEKLERETSKPD